MPASEAQIAANKKNALRSTGPTSEAGRAQSAMNATKHGFCAASPTVEANLSPAFVDRRARWAAEQQPVGEAGNFALDRVIAASFRIERCEQAINNVITDVQQRASLTWDEDRNLEAATLAARLPKNPVVVSRELQTSLSGVILLIEAWLLLASVLENGDWSELEVSKALDLLGVDPDYRSARMPIDGPAGTDPIAFRRELALAEISRLEEIRDESMIPLDDLARRHAMAGASALLSKQAKLLLRYEREAWNHYNQSMKDVKASKEFTPPVVVAPAPAPVAETKPIAPEPIPTPPSPPDPAEPSPVTNRSARRGRLRRSGRLARPARQPARLDSEFTPRIVYPNGRRRLRLPDS